MLETDLLLLVKMDYVKNFNNDLKVGRLRERQRAGILLSKRWDITKIEFAPDKKFYDRDVKITAGEKETTYEVKQDFKSQYTNNIALEYECRGEPSWISTSKSDYIVVCPKEWEFYFQKRPALLAKLMEAGLKGVPGGDKMASKMFLIGKEHLWEYFKWPLCL